MKIAVVGACSGGANILEYFSTLSNKSIEIYFWGKKKDIPKEYLKLEKYYGYPVVGMYDEIPKESDVYLSIGDLKTKEKYFEYFKKNGYHLPNIIHPTSYIAKDVVIPSDSGIQILARSVVQIGSTIEENVLINNMVLIDHECRIGKSSHIAGGCILASKVSIGSRTLVGTGTCIHYGVTVGDDCIIGIGSNITRNISSHSFIPVREQMARLI